MSASPAAPGTVLAALEQTLDADLDALFEFVRIPSVSADPDRAADVRRAAAFVADQLGASGRVDVAVHETSGHPVVTGTWRGAPGAPSLVVYGHYDVQPPDPLDRWRTPPFEPTIADGRIYARGVSDDKAPMLIPITVANAYFAAVGALPVNVVFVFEGEEEVGSPSLPSFARRHAGWLRSDLVASADGGMWRAEHPSTMISARGLLALEITVRGVAKDLHSGRHGGGVANALHALASLIAGLHGADGRVEVAGFYDDVHPLEPALREATAALPFDEAAYLREVGASLAVGESGFSTLERQWYRPTVEVNGMWGGYIGPGSKTVLPSEAHAKLTCRLVPDQDPDRVHALLERHLRERLPEGTTLEVRGKAGSRAYRLPPEHPGLSTALAALEAVYGVEPWVVGMGGSVPICSTFQRELGMDTVFFSFAVGDEDIHAPNEFFRLARFEQGRRAWAEFFARLPRAYAGSG